MAAPLPTAATVMAAVGAGAASVNCLIVSPTTLRLGSLRAPLPRYSRYRPPPPPSNQVARDLAFSPALDHRPPAQPTIAASFASPAAGPPAPPPSCHWPLHPAALDPSYCRDQLYLRSTVPPFSPYVPGPALEASGGPARVQCHRCGGFGHIARNCATGRRMSPPVFFRCRQPGHLQAQCPGNQRR
ncbi:hypothetical protein HPB48_015664 [Haemaphysalis longicornis]|uniref:CCHC-type domain-containing protein n=1 Tax=Haemaphysalis longicornis TaxID=44386 RepID=A0A9J6GIR4_HAELO|nr:hypothetical protein HPB48_015664 [Haemaphysalis longicornis]